VRPHPWIRRRHEGAAPAGSRLCPIPILNLWRSRHKKKSRISPALGDKVIYAFTQALRRVTRPTIWSLFEPRYEQDLSANPKRTAKSSFATHQLDVRAGRIVQKIEKKFLQVSSY
jgi:hypothetical protein